MKSFILLAFTAMFLLASCQKERFQSENISQHEDVIDNQTINLLQKEAIFDPILENTQKTNAAKARRQTCAIVTVFIDYEGETGVDGSPWGIPGTMSTSTTSYASFSANRCATVPPTFPAPTTVIFGRPIIPPREA
jgi:hypothetical protein